MNNNFSVVRETFSETKKIVTFQLILSVSTNPHHIPAICRFRSNLQFVIFVFVSLSVNKHLEDVKSIFMQCSSKIEVK